MAKLTYLELTNRVLRRITQADITDVSAATGQALIITDLINEAQMELFNEDNWYSLYSTTTFPTVADTAEYAAWNGGDGRTIDLMDTTNNLIITEDISRSFDTADPDADQTGNPLFFAIQGSNYRLWPTPDGTATIRERWWKVPDEMTTNAALYDMPIEVENCILDLARAGILEYLKDSEGAEYHRRRVYGIPGGNQPGLLDRAKKFNKRKIDRLIKMGAGSGRIEGVNGITPPRFPSNYQQPW